MSRPTYETEKHLEQERKAVEALEALHGWRLMKTPKYYHIDYCAVGHSNEVLAWLEVRGKNFPKSQHPTFYTSLEKFLSVARMAHLTNIPAYLIVRWADCTNYLKVSHGDARRYKIRIGGRTIQSRNDPDDIEPVIHIPTKEFACISSMFL